MRIVVFAPEPRSPARCALEMEGIDVLEVLCTHPTIYGERFSTLWNAADKAVDKFIAIEHDIIPWPGAVEALWDCPEPRCTHRYPLHQGNVTLGFGIGKYAPIGPAPAEWRTTEWRMLDGLVVPVLNERLGPPHVHEPPVAHARTELAR